MPRRATERITERLVRSLPAPTSGAAITYDANVPGFGIRVTANSVRSFVLNYVVNGRERRMTIGRFPTWSATAAREQARSLRRRVDAKTDPLEERHAQKLAKRPREQHRQCGIFSSDMRPNTCRGNRLRRLRTIAACGRKSSCPGCVI
jgi:Arm DNA-binding domain